MKKYLLIILLLSTSFFYSQTLPETEIKISDVSLPSAQAFEMTKRGSVPIDESSGRLGLNIPLGSLIEGDINVPITLNYSGPGVKMSSVSTWTGVNWSLNAGGVITRVVKDLPDDYYEEKIYDLLTILGENPSNQLLTENQYKLSNGQNYDSQYDVFTFSFLNYSGEFIIKREGENLIPIIVKNTDNLKIEIIGSFRKDQDYEFVITDTNGMKFYFGGDLIVSDMNSATGAAIEETQIADNPISNRRNKKYKSAFYLTKIESYKGDIVYFEYYNEEMYKNYFYDNQYIDQLIYTSSNEITNISDCDNFSPILNNYNYADRFIDNRIFNGKFLRWIRGASGKKIIFNSIRKETPDLTSLSGANLLKYRILTDVIFVDKKIKLEYFPTIDQIQNGNNNYDRFFLTNVKFNDLNNQNNNNIYKLEYENLEQTPLNFNKGQDHMGYFNGHSNNQSLIPNNVDVFIKKFFKETYGSSTATNNPAFNFNNQYSFLANRDPNFNYAKYGSLKRIIYPEKGWTEFEYEPVILDELKENKNLLIYHNRTGACKMKDEFLLTNFYLGIDDETYSGLMPTQDLIITMNMVGLKTQGVHLDYHDFGRLKITDQNTNEITIQKIHLKAEDVYNDNEIYEPGSQNNSNEVNASLYFSFEYNNSHTYKFELEYGDENYGSNGDIISSPNSNFLSNTSISVNFSFVVGLNLNQGLGLRVKRVKDFDNLKPNPEVKRFYYKSFHNVGNIYFDNKIETFNPFYFDAYSERGLLNKLCSGSCESGGSYKIIYYYNYFVRLQSNPIFNKFYSQDVAAIYKNVTISFGGDEFENGGVEKTFLLEKDINENRVIINGDQDCQVWQYCGPNKTVIRNPIFENLIINMKSYKNVNKTNVGALNGILLKEDYFIYKNGFNKNKTIKYNYLNVEQDSLNSFSTEIIYDLQTYISPCVQNIYLGNYKTKIFKPFLKEIETIEYIDLLDYRQFISTYYHKGDSHKDFDNDGILNFMDEDYIITFEEYESDRKKITTKVTYDYSQTNMVNMANEIVKTSSDSSIVSKQKIYYPIQNQISLLSNLNSNDLNYYTSLTNAHRISQPIQMESFQNNENLTRSRLLYGTFNGKIMPRMVQKSKGQQSWFSTDEITNYDSKFNMSEIKNLETNIFTSFKYTNDGLPLCKAYNLTINQLNSNWSQIADYTLDPNGATTPNANNIYDLFPSARFKFFKYDIISRKLIEEKDENKQIKTYLYDSFFNLKTIKDHDGNILKEFDQQFKPQN